MSIKTYDYGITATTYDGQVLHYRKRAAYAAAALAAFIKGRHLPGAWKSIEVSELGIEGLPLVRLTRPLDAKVRDCPNN